MGSGLRYSPLKYDLITNPHTGAKQRTLTLGKDAEGTDFIIYGDTSGSYMKWDASANSLGFAGSAEIDIAVGSVDLSTVGGINFTGAMTDAIVISGTCSDNGIEISGVCTGNAINIADTHNCVYIAPAADTTGSEYGLKISSTSTFSAVAAHKALQIEHAHTPSSAGTACPIAIVGKLTMGGDNTASNNYPGMGFGIQGQLHIATGSTFDGSTFGDTVGAMYCGVRAVCTDAGTSTYTKGKIACSFNDMQLTQNASAGANFKVYGIYNYIYNAAGNTNVDAVIAIDAHASLTAGTIEKGIQFISTAPVTVGISLESAMTTGLSFAGTYTGNAIDFSSATIAPTGSNGPCFIRAGTYASPIDYSTDTDQSGMIRMYSTTSATSTSYDRGIFACCKTTGTKGVMPIAGLAEVGAQSGAGPTDVHAGQFIVDINSATATIGASTTNWAGVAGVWAKIATKLGSVTNASSRLASIWLDMKLSGTTSGTSYMAWITPFPKVDAIFGFNSEGSTHIADHLFYFDSSCADKTPVVTTGCNVSGAGGDEAYLAVLLNATEYGIPLIAIS